jgi:hypothetical protein
MAVGDASGHAELEPAGPQARDEGLEDGWRDADTGARAGHREPGDGLGRVGEEATAEHVGREERAGVGEAAGAVDGNEAVSAVEEGDESVEGLQGEGVTVVGTAAKRLDVHPPVGERAVVVLSFIGTDDEGDAQVVEKVCVEGGAEMALAVAVHPRAASRHVFAWRFEEDDFAGDDDVDLAVDWAGNKTGKSQCR